MADPMFDVDDEAGWAETPELTDEEAIAVFGGNDKALAEVCRWVMKLDDRVRSTGIMLGTAAKAAMRDD